MRMRAYQFHAAEGLGRCFLHAFNDWLAAAAVAIASAAGLSQSTSTVWMPNQSWLGLYSLQKSRWLQQTAFE
jgi:hypothetical protein